VALPDSDFLAECDHVDFRKGGRLGGGGSFCFRWPRSLVLERKGMGRGTPTKYGGSAWFSLKSKVVRHTIDRGELCGRDLMGALFLSGWGKEPRGGSTKGHDHDLNRRVWEVRRHLIKSSDDQGMSEWRGGG